MSMNPENGQPAPYPGNEYEVAEPSPTEVRERAAAILKAYIDRGRGDAADLEARQTAEARQTEVAKIFSEKQEAGSQPGNTGQAQAYSFEDDRGGAVVLTVAEGEIAEAEVFDIDDFTGTLTAEEYPEEVAALKRLVTGDKLQKAARLQP